MSLAEERVSKRASKNEKNGRAADKRERERERERVEDER